MFITYVIIADKTPAPEYVPGPFLGLGIFTLVICGILVFLKLPKIDEGKQAEEESGEKKQYKSSVFKYTHVWLGALGIFMYMGVEIGVPSMLPYRFQLLYPDIADYEVMPWPERIYEGLYRKSADSEERIRIPKDYSTMMQVMIGTLNDMPLSENKLSGTQGISVLMGNSLMFQRFPTHAGYEDPQLSNFYGLAMPILKRGIPVGITHIENVGYKASLKDVKVLLMTYSNMKSLDA
jgi:hypothetical protein